MRSPSTMSRARRSACPLPASRPPRPRSARRRRARRDEQTIEGSRRRHVRRQQRGRGGCAGRFPSATAKGGGLRRGRRGRGQSLVRLGRQAGYVPRGRDVAVSSLLRHWAPVTIARLAQPLPPAAALRACRLRAYADLPFVPALGAVSGPAPLVGYRRRHHGRGDPRLRHRRRRGIHRPRDHADAARRRARGHLYHPVARGDAANHRLDRSIRRVVVHRLCHGRSPPWTHRGYDISQLVGHLFITLEGIFGIPVDVSSSLIILFTIYGAFLQHSGAGKFFIDFSMALMGHKANSAGRTVVLSSFLLGGPSGSGVATTVTIGAVAYPLMQRAGFEKNAAGGLLAAGGLGAIISPPVLGAAAFLIAEFLKISYLDVIWMATIPTCLYYLSLLFMVELDAKRFGAHTVDFR